MSKSNIRAGLLVGASLALSACGGGGGGGGGGGQSIEVPRDMDRLERYLGETSRLLDTFDDSRKTTASDLPPGQTAYRGVGVIDTNPDQLPDRRSGVLGRARIDADFDSNTLEASVGEFVDIETGEVIGGTLSVRNGTLRDGAISGDLQGRLDGGTIRGVGEGAIYADRGEGVAISTNGTISGGRYDGAFGGAMIAEW